MWFKRTMYKILKILESLILFPIIYMPNPLGVKIRYWYYKRKFMKIGDNVRIDEGVLIKGAKWISVGDNVWIDKYCVLIAGKADLDGKVVKHIENKDFKEKEGTLIIGSGVHLGAFNIIQSHGGLYIGDNVTTSACVKIYSLSNYPYNEENREVITFANCMVREKDRISYIVSPIVINDGVWIALDCIILGGTIDNNSFISSQSIVFYDIPENSYVFAKPTIKIRKRFIKED